MLRFRPSLKWIILCLIWVLGLLVSSWLTPGSPRPDWKFPRATSIVGLLKDGHTLLAGDANLHFYHSGRIHTKLKLDMSDQIQFGYVELLELLQGPDIIFVVYVNRQQKIRF